MTTPYAWDAAGNPAGAGVVVGAGNRLLNDGEFTFAYDAEGRRTQRVNIATSEKITYGYDAAGRLINEKQFASTSSTNPLFSLDIAYDAVGRRKTQTENTYTGSQITNTAVDHFHYNGWNVSSLTNGVSGSYLDYVHGVGTDSMLAELSFSGTAANASLSGVLHTQTDHQGSVTDFAVYDQALNRMVTAGHRDYDAFGGLNSSTGSAAAIDHLFGYAGRERMPIADQYDNRMRGYDAATGRFLTPDPLGLRAGDMNLYRYVGNDAVNYIDPLGLTEQPSNNGPPEGRGYPESQSIPNTNRHAAGVPEEQDNCSCSCSCGTSDNQLPANAPSAGSQSQASPASSPTLTNPRALGSGMPTSLSPLTQDPSGIAAGNANLFRYVGNNPSISRDPSGLIDDESLIMRNPANRPPFPPPFSPGNCLSDGFHRINIPHGALVITAPHDPRGIPYGPQNNEGHPSSDASSWPDVVAAATIHPARPAGGWPAIVLSAHGSVNGGIRTGPRLPTPEGQPRTSPRPDELHMGGNILQEDAETLLSLLAPGAPIIFSACQQGYPLVAPMERLIDLFPGHPIFVQPGDGTIGLSGGTQPWVELNNIIPSRRRR